MTTSGDATIDAPSDAISVGSDAPPLGSCNGAPCASGCDCEPSSSDAGGGVCLCMSEDASVVESDAADADAGEVAEVGSDAAVGGVDGEVSDGDTGDGASLVDVNTPGDASADAELGDTQSLDASTDADAMPAESGAQSPCGIILCGAACTCVSQAMSACVCP